MGIDKAAVDAAIKSGFFRPGPLDRVLDAAMKGIDQIEATTYASGRA